MIAKPTAKPKWTAADRVRHKATRKEFAPCPTQEDLKASGDYEGPIKSGAYFAVKTIIHELKKARETAGLTLAAVSKLTGMDQATLSRLENGRQPNPTVDTLWRCASAVGRQLVLTHAEPESTPLENSKNEIKLEIEEFLEEVDEWKFKVHEKLKGMSPAQRKAYWNRIHEDARARGLNVVEPEKPVKRPPKQVR